MKQHNFLTDVISSEHPDSLVQQERPVWQLFVDGAARNNPGDAGIGIHILHYDMSVVKQGFYIGITTNNQAEYTALLIGLAMLKDLVQPDDTLLISSDSELMVKQIQGVYRVRQPELQKLYAHALNALRSVRYRIRHVPRSHNKVADEYANKGIDNKIVLPESLLRNVLL